MMISLGGWLCCPMGIDRKLAMSERQNLNDVVALLADLPAKKLLRVQAVR